MPEQINMKGIMEGERIAVIGDGSLLLEACSLGEAQPQDGVIVGERAIASTA